MPITANKAALLSDIEAFRSNQTIHTAQSLIKTYGSMWHTKNEEDAVLDRLPERDQQLISTAYHFTQSFNR